MSGVLDGNGVQWEHCNACSKMVPIFRLLYERPSAGYPLGRDLCRDCGTPDSRPGQPVTIPVR
jgi:hypothetical protein